MQRSSLLLPPGGYVFDCTFKMVHASICSAYDENYEHKSCSLQLTSNLNLNKKYNAPARPLISPFLKILNAIRRYNKGAVNAPANRKDTVNQPSLASSIARI